MKMLKKLYEALVAVARAVLDPSYFREGEYLKEKRSK